METHAWYTELKGRLAHAVISERESVPGEIEITVRKEHAKEFLAQLKTLPGGGFGHLADLTAYDNVPAAARFNMVYELISMTLKQRCAVIVPLEGDKPEADSITDLWKGANWLEREVYDMYGINFVGHPDQRRILLPDSFVGFPLRKDFVADYRQEYAPNTDDDETFDPFGNNVVKSVEG